MSGSTSANDAADPQMAAIRRRRAMAQMLMQQSQSQEVIRSPWQGLARVLQAVGGGATDYMAGREEDRLNTDRRAGANQFMAALLGGQGGPAAGQEGGAPPAPVMPQQNVAPAPAPSAPVAQAAPPNIYGRNQDRVAQRDALLGADPVQLASASQANLPPGQPAFNPARPGASSELPGWDAGTAPPTGRVMPIGNAALGQALMAPSGGPVAAPAASPMPRAAPSSVPDPNRLMAAYAAAANSDNPLIARQAPQLLQMAQFGSLQGDRTDRRQDRAEDNARADRQFTATQQHQAATLALQERVARATELARSTGQIPEGYRLVNGRLEEIPGGPPARVGLNPIYGQGADGQPVVMLPNTRGQLQQPALPEGVTPTIPTRDLNLGTSFATIPSRGTGGVTSRPIDIRGREGQERIGGSEGDIAAAAPRAIVGADRMLTEIQDVLDHPAFARSTGVLSFTGVLPGTPMADFANRVEQIKGQAFLEAFNQLRGGGAITEAEGRKATAALGRLERNVSPSDFRRAMQDLQGVIVAGRSRAEDAGRRAGTIPPAAPAPQMPIPGTGQGASPPEAQGGATAVNPATGQRLRLQGGQWVPAQ